jgi:TetR/AcrR family transcriptional regulator, transcriptional repressor for nem operon
MRYPADHKERARDALLQAGSRSLKTSGFNGIGVDALAAVAGVTSGAFYSNFANKAAMLDAVIDAGAGEPFLSDTDSATPAEGRAHLIELLHTYISTNHSAAPAEGCVIPALSADVARAEEPVKKTYQRKMTALADRIAGFLDVDQADRQQRAWSIIALMVGSQIVSRGFPDESETRTAPINSALSTATALIGEDSAD